MTASLTLKLFINSFSSSGENYDKLKEATVTLCEHDHLENPDQSIKELSIDIS